jgi:hypothetical protein
VIFCQSVDRQPTSAIEKKRFTNKLVVYARLDAGLCVALHFTSLRHAISPPHFSKFTSLDLGLFTNPSDMSLFATISTLACEAAVDRWKNM